jgi:hypothetical protein
MSGMSCREFERSLMDRARSRPMDAALRTALTAHLEICARCRGALERQLRLSAAMETLAEQTAGVSAPPAVERAVLAELNAVPAGGRRRWIYGAVGGALAASLAMALWLNRPVPKKVEAHVTPPAVAHEAPEPAPVKTVAASPVKRRAKPKASPAPNPEAPFVAIPYTLPIEPWERIDVVRMDMPVAALIAAGVPVGVVDPSARARTDVLMGQDGRARAVRLVSFTSLN